MALIDCRFCGKRTSEYADNCFECGKDLTSDKVKKRVDTPKKLLKNCADCQKEISINAMTCPHCGAPNREAEADQRVVKRALALLILFIGFIAFFIFPLIGVLLLVFGLIYLLINFY